MPRTPRSVHFVTFLITLMAAACCLLQVVAPFRGALQFLTVQVTFVAGAVTYARALRWLLDPTQGMKARLILRGNMVVLVSTAATLMLDTFAEYQRMRAAWVGIAVLIFEVLTMIGFWVLSSAFRGVSMPEMPRGLGPADGLDDLLTLVRWAAALEGRGITNWLAQIRRHSWGFAIVLGMSAGVVFFTAHLQEGLPPNLSTGLLIGGIFIGIEFAATLLGYAALGPYLGLRPVSASSHK